MRGEVNALVRVENIVFNQRSVNPRPHSPRPEHFPRSKHIRRFVITSTNRIFLMSMHACEFISYCPPSIPYTKHKQSPVMTKKCHKPKLQANLPPSCYHCLLLLTFCLRTWMEGRTEWWVLCVGGG